MLRERLQLSEITVMLASFITVLFLIVCSEKYNDHSKDDKNDFTIGVVLNVVAAILFSTLDVAIRQLKQVHYSIIAFFQSMGNLILSTCGLIVYRTCFNPNHFYYNLDGQDIILLFVYGILRSVSGLLSIKAFQMDKAGRIASLSFL